MSRHLFLLTITPVQSFIIAARKTQDLYAGSYILSHLCRAAINKAKTYYNAEIIFPDTDLKSLPNRLLAIFDTENDDEKLTDIGRDIEQTVLEEFYEMAGQIIIRLDLPLHDDLPRQINNYFQVFWTFYPLEGRVYTEAYKQIEASLSSIKNVRKFGQLGEEGQKCPVTGEHNVLYYKNNENKKKRIKDAILVPERIPDKYLAPEEALGGIAFVKRCADRFFGEEFNSRFPSTSRVALMDALNQLAMKNNEYHNIVDSEFDEQDIFNLRNGTKCVNDQLAEKVYKQLDYYKITYSPYYAVILFDGDSMGTWLSGTKLKNGVSLQKFHSQLSAKLGSFAKVAGEQVLVLPKGITVYAGGDDFLGLVSLSYLLEVMKELRERFEHTIDLSEFADEKLTFSAGVAVAHYKTPLAEVLAWARRMEKEAKKIDMGKDAFGLAILKHSGEINKSVYKWKCDGEWTTYLVNQLISYIKNDFSSSFIKTFNLEFRPLVDNNGRLDPEKISDGMIKGELKRLVDRVYLNNIGVLKVQKQADKERKVNDLLTSLWKLYLNNRYFNNFLSLLDFAVFMEREVNDNA